MGLPWWWAWVGPLLKIHTNPLPGFPVPDAILAIGLLLIFLGVLPTTAQIGTSLSGKTERG